jgi:Glycosyl transferase family 2
VNDNSLNLELYAPLRDYVAKNFPAKVKIKNLEKRSGLIRTRLEGARMATGEFLVVSCFEFCSCLSLIKLQF